MQEKAQKKQNHIYKWFTQGLLILFYHPPWEVEKNSKKNYSKVPLFDAKSLDSLQEETIFLKYLFYASRFVQSLSNNLLQIPNISLTKWC